MKMQTLKLDVENQLELASQDGENPPSFAINAYTGATFQYPGIPEPVTIDLSGVTHKPKQPIFRNHDQDIVLGHGAPSKSADGLHVTGILSGPEKFTADVIAMARQGFPWQASIGIRPGKIELVKQGKTATVNGRTVNGPHRIVRTGNWYETSVCPLGTDQDTSTTISASFQDETMTTKETNESTELESTESTDIEMVLNRAKNERNRQTKIAAIASGAIDNGTDLQTVEGLTKQAIQLSWTPEEFELRLLRGSRSRAYLPNSQAGRLDPEVLECQFAAYSGLDIDKHYSEAVCDRAMKTHPRGMGLHELVRLFARRNGWTGEGIPEREAFQLAARPGDNDMQLFSGFSSVSIANILANVANKKIQDGFNAVESAWREICAIARVNDFKEQSYVSLLGDLTYEKVTNGGEIKHGSLADRSLGNKAETYAKLIALTRQDIRNDDVGALDRSSNKLGRGAALRLNLEVWGAFLDNSTFFSAGNANLFDNGPLTFDNLGKAEKRFLERNDPDGNPLGLMPKILVVPVALKNDAQKFYVDREIRVDGASSKTTYTTGNNYVGAFKPVWSTYLSNASLTGNSATDWYLLADPMDLPVIEVCFLDGIETPIIDSSEADFSHLGIQLRGYHDFGVRKQNPEAGIRVNAAAGAATDL